MTITALPAAPDPNIDADSVFSAKAQAWSLALATFVTEANSLATALNLNATNDTSATSNTLGTGAKTFTASAGKSFQPGMYLVIADTAAPSTNSMIAQVTSYNSGTGALVVNVVSFSGSGTKTAWTISQSMLTASVVGDHEVTVHTGNGTGSTNNKVRRYSTLQRSVGTAVTYADSATLGATFTINEAGLYEVYTADESSAAPTIYGASLNSANLTTSIKSIPATERLSISYGTGGTGVVNPAVTRTVRLSAGDVVRAHADGLPAGTTVGYAIFSIRKVGL